MSKQHSSAETFRYTDEIRGCLLLFGFTEEYAVRLCFAHAKLILESMPAEVYGLADKSHRKVARRIVIAEMNERMKDDE